MKKILALVGVIALMIITIVLLALKTNKPVDPEQAAALERAVSRYMANEPVEPYQFPWFDPTTRAFNPNVLKSHLDKGTLTEEEYQAFLKFRTYWKRSE